MRRLGAIGLAVVVAVGLFWMMHALVYLSLIHISEPTRPY